MAVIPAGIGTNSPTGPYTIPSTGALTIFLFSAAAGANGSPAFDPLTEITSPVTLTINGVVFPNITLTPSPSATDPGEVKFTLTAADVLKLNLVASTTPISFTIKGKTNVPIPVVFVGRAVNDVTVTGGGGGGGGGGSGVVQHRRIRARTAATILPPPIFTGDLQGQAFPPVASLEHLASYQPLPVQLAYQQFLPDPGFRAREEVYHHPSKGKTAHQAPAGTVLNVGPIAHSENKYDKYNSLIKKVFTRGKFKVGKTTTFTHKVKVIPTSSQTERLPGLIAELEPGTGISSHDARRPAPLDPRGGCRPQFYRRQRFRIRPKLPIRSASRAGWPAARGRGCGPACRGGR